MLMLRVINVSASFKKEMKTAVKRSLYFVPRASKNTFNPPYRNGGYHKVKACGHCSKALLYSSTSTELQVNLGAILFD